MLIIYKRARLPMRQWAQPSGSRRWHRSSVLPTLCVGMRCGWQGIITYMYAYTLSLSQTLVLARRV